MATSTETTHVHQVFIRATPEAIWDAITKPEWTIRYGYQPRVEYDLRPGGAYRAIASEAMRAQGAPDVAVEGEVIESDPPRKLVQTWRPVWDEQIAKETSRLTYEIEQDETGVSKLTVIHELEGAPLTLAMVSGQVEGAGDGWPQVLSDLKSLLETGEALYD